MRITVIGAGVIGLSCAFELSELGHTVTVVDGGATGAGGSAGNAGWITPFLSSPRAAPGAVRDAVRSFASTQGPAQMRPHLEPAFAAWVTQFLRASSSKRSARTTAALQAMPTVTGSAILTIPRLASLRLIDPIADSVQYPVMGANVRGTAKLGTFRTGGRPSVIH